MAGDTTLLLAVIVALLIAVSAALAASETVLARLDLVRGLRLREEEARGGEALLWLLERRATALDVVLLLTVTGRVAVAALTTVVALALLPGAAGVVLTIALVTLVSVLLAEIAPRTLILRHLETGGLWLAPVLAPVVRLLEPVSRVTLSAGRALVPRRSVGNGEPGADEETSEHGDDDEDSDDSIAEDEHAMIRSIFELGETAVREIMVPRPDMVTISEEATREELLATLVEFGHSRVPVHRDSRDDICGIVYAKDVLKLLASDGHASWQSVLRPPTYVPESKRVDDLLRELQDRAVHLAVVVDEYGDLAGLVTIEDILEEIVGEIIDEHDHEDPLVEFIDDVAVRIDARLPVGDLNQIFDSELPDEDWDTVGGLVVGTLGRVPEPGEPVEIGGMTLTAERVQGRRVSKVLAERRVLPDVAVDDEGTAEHEAVR